MLSMFELDRPGDSVGVSHACSAMWSLAKRTVWCQLGFLSLEFDFNSDRMGRIIIPPAHVHFLDEA